MAPNIVFTEDERSELGQLSHLRITKVRLAHFARIVLLAAEGIQNQQIAEQLGIGWIQVARFRRRYGQLRLAEIERDLPRGEQPAKVDVAHLVQLTTRNKPKAATHWSMCTMAAELGISWSRARGIGRLLA